jgi:hypothetical protein
MPPLDVNPPVAPAVAQVNGSSADLRLHCNRATGDATGARWHFVDRAFCRFSVAKLNRCWLGKSPTLMRDEDQAKVVSPPQSLEEFDKFVDCNRDFTEM